METFEEIVKDHSPKIYYFLRRLGLDHDDADEIVQDVFILLWRDLKNGTGLWMVSFRLHHHAIQKVLNFLKDDRTTDVLIFVLKHYQGFDFDDISEMTGMGSGDVRDRYK